MSKRVRLAKPGKRAGRISQTPVRGTSTLRVRPYPRETPIGVHSSALSPPSGQSHFFAQQRGWHAVSSRHVAAALEC